MKDGRNKIWRNPFANYIFNLDETNFTTKFGMILRRIINKPFRCVLKMILHGNVSLEKYPNLNKHEVYIFAAAHSFTNDVIAALAYIDRSMYVLNGSTHQIKHNPGMLALAMYGQVYVDRFCEESRKSSIMKMKKIIQNGTSVYMYPEGAWNNSENLLLLPFFAGPWILAKETKCKVVPVAAFNEMGKDKIYIRVGEPLDISELKKDEGIRLVRDSIATEIYEMIEKHSTPIIRKSIDIEAERISYLEARKRNYFKGAFWYDDVWDEEIIMYKDKRFSSAKDVRETYKRINLNVRNARWLIPILSQVEDDIKYDFKKYMHENWNK